MESVSLDNSLHNYIIHFGNTSGIPAFPQHTSGGVFPMQKGRPMYLNDFINEFHGCGIIATHGKIAGFKEGLIHIEKNLIDREGEWEEDIFLVLLDNIKFNEKSEQLGLSTIPVDIDNNIDNFESVTSHNLEFLIGHVDKKNVCDLFTSYHELSLESTMMENPDSHIDCNFEQDRDNFGDS